MGTSQAENMPSRRNWLAKRGERHYFPTGGIENLVLFLTESGFCDTEQGMMKGFTPNSVMGWETFLGRTLTQNERRAVIPLSANYATFHNRWHLKTAVEPYQQVLYIEIEG